MRGRAAPGSGAGDHQNAGRAKRAREQPMSPAAVLSSHRLCAPRWGRGRLSGRADRRSAATLTGVVNLTSDSLRRRRGGLSIFAWAIDLMCGHRLQSHLAAHAAAAARLDGLPSPRVCVNTCPARTPAAVPYFYCSVVCWYLRCRRRCRKIRLCRKGASWDFQK